MIRLLTDPDRFFRDLGTDPGFGRPGLVVLSVALPVALLELVYSVLGESGLAWGLANAVSLGVGAVFMWAIMGVVLHGLVRLAGGSGGLDRTVGVVGWGFLPWVVMNAVQLCAALAIVALGVGPDASTLQAQVEGAAVYRVLDSTALLGVFALWAGLLWSLGLRHAQELRLGRAGTVVALPVGGLLALALVLEVVA